MHTPVLVKDVLECLKPQPNENFIDCTVGEGGHSALILERNAPRGMVLGIDLDSEQIKECQKNTARFGDRIVLVNGSYANLADIAKQNNFNSVN